MLGYFLARKLVLAGPRAPSFAISASLVRQLIFMVTTVPYICTCSQRRAGEPLATFLRALDHFNRVPCTRGLKHHSGAVIQARRTRFRTGLTSCNVLWRCNRTPRHKKGNAFTLFQEFFYYVPLVLTTLCRPEHTKTSLDYYGTITVHFF